MRVTSKQEFTGQAISSLTVRARVQVRPIQKKITEREHNADLVRVRIRVLPQKITKAGAMTVLAGFRD